MCRLQSGLPRCPRVETKLSQNFSDAADAEEIQSKKIPDICPDMVN